jgi:hypothetical protein
MHLRVSSGVPRVALSHLQLVAKLALWGLSRQELLLGFLTTKAGAVLRALLPSLTVDNRWQVHVLTHIQHRLPEHRVALM